MNFKSFYKLAGPCGIVLVIIGIVAIFLSSWCFCYTSLIWYQFKKNFLDLADSRARCLKDYNGTNPFLIIIHDIVATHAKHSDDMRAEVGYLYYCNFRKVNSFLTVLKLISVISPLLGLLGTVLGMLSVFQVISEQAVPEPGVLASGIWQALVTTVMGLCVAIPVLVFYYLLSLRMKAFHIEIIEHCYRAIEICRKVINDTNPTENTKNMDCSQKCQKN